MKRLVSWFLVALFVLSTCMTGVAFADPGENIECSLSIRNEKVELEESAEAYKEVYTISNIPAKAQLLAKSECEIGTLEMYYQWDNGDVFCLNGVSEVEINIPEEFELGSQHVLMIRSISNEYMDSGKEYYFITIIEANGEFLSIGIKDKELFLSPNAQYSFKQSDFFTVVTDSFNGARIEYIWGNSETSSIHPESEFQVSIPSAEELANGLSARAVGKTGETDWFYIRLSVNTDK